MVPFGGVGEAQTVSLKVTEEPKLDGLGELVRTEVVGRIEPEVTTWDSEALEFVKLPSVLA